MDTFFQGKTILITGSGRGIGAATARLAKSYGANVILHDREENEDLEHFSQEIDSPFIACDVADRDAVFEAIQKIAQTHPHIDTLINSAGIALSSSFLDMTDDDWMDEYRVNFLGTVHFCQAVIPLMQKQRSGHIVNIASIRGHSAGVNPSRPSYSATKSAIINLTASLAKEFAPHITVNAVSPGYVETDMAQTWSEETRAKVNTSLLGRAAKPEEIAEILLFLGSDRAIFITGQTILADGGYLMAGR